MNNRILKKTKVSVLAGRWVSAVLAAGTVAVCFLPLLAMDYAGTTVAYSLFSLPVPIRLGEWTIGMPAVTYLLGFSAPAFAAASAGLLFAGSDSRGKARARVGALARWSPLAALAAVVALLLVQLTAAVVPEALHTAGMRPTGMAVLPAFYIALALLLANCAATLWSQGREAGSRSVFLSFSAISIASVVLITGYVLVSGLPAILEIGPVEFLFGTVWTPTSAADPSFGIFNMILGSIASTLGAIFVGVPVGLLTAVFLAEIAPRPMAALVRPSVELLAGIPSVVYGFFGLQLLVPLVRQAFGLKTGATLFSAMVILAVMVLPTIINTAETGLRAVPASYKEASLALGATHIETIFKVLVPAARAPILSGVILGVGRAIGETMAIIMVAGNLPLFPSLFHPVKPLTVGIAMEMSYSVGLHRQALFAIGLVLFVFIMIVNVGFSRLSRQGVAMDGKNE